MLLVLVAIALCGALVALVFFQHTYSDVLALSRIPFYLDDYLLMPVNIAEAAFERVRSAVGVGFVLALLLPLVSLFWAPVRREYHGFFHETRLAISGAFTRVRGLPSWQRWGAGLALLVLTAVRGYFSWTLPAQTDEIATYDFFIRHGLLAVSSFYPIPNNHPLSSLMGWVFFNLHPNSWFVLRLPVVLTATVATIVLFVGLLRFGSFWISLSSLVIFSWMQTSLYYAAVGRGYWLLIAWASLMFFAVLKLSEPTGTRQRPAWALLLMSGILGCYTMPPFVYVVASASSYLGIGFLRRRAWAELGQLIIINLGIVLGALILYLPVVVVSGWQALFANRYVAPTTLAEVLHNLPNFLWSTEGRLMGQRGIGGVVLVLGLGLLAWRWWTAPTSPQAAARQQQLRQLGRPALWFMALPYALLLAQHVEPPYRVLVYKGLFSALVWGLLVRQWLAHAPGRRWVVVAVLVAFAGYQVHLVARDARQERVRTSSHAAVFTWLQSQPPGRILVGPGDVGLYLLFWAHYEKPLRRWQLESVARPGRYYRYRILPINTPPPPLPAKVVYTDAIQSVYESKAR